MSVNLKIIKRYLDGIEKQHRDDYEKILNWFLDISAEKELRRNYYDYWNEMPLEKDIKKDNDKQKIHGSIYHRMYLDENKHLQRKKTVQKHINNITRIAAILFIPLLLYFLLSNNIFTTYSETAFSEIYAPLGARAMFTLPDGSSGWLNSGSFLKFPTEFKNKTRNVELKGEAFFKVKSDEGKPFIVSGTEIEVAAYGTSFNVNSYPEDMLNKVTLIKGKIRCYSTFDGKRNSKKYLNPGEMLVNDRNNYSYNKIIDVDTSKITAWKDGKLVFRDETFDEVVRKINRWYNVNIVIKDDELKTYRYIATFQDETLDEVLKLLKHSAPIDYRIEDRTKKKDDMYKKKTIELYYKHK
ncbi:MAG: FecR family protein [Bacteroidota bacterium]